VGAPLPAQATLADKVHEAMAAVYGCDSGRCVVEDGRAQAQRKIIDQLRAMGVCAGEHDPGHTDEIAAAVDQASVREGYHVYAGPDAGPGTLLFPPDAVRPAWAPLGATPTPPPAGGSCPSPVPPRVWTAETLPDGWGENEIGRPRWLLLCVRHGRVIDCTPQVAPQAWDYCESIGMGTTADGQRRGGCPVRNEGVPEREACEAYITGGGTRLQTCAAARAADPDETCQPIAGATCERAGGNPLQFVPNDGQCRLCSADGKVCGEFF